MLVYCHCCKKRVLLWDQNNISYATGLSGVKASLTSDPDVLADLSSAYTGNLGDYNAIFWPGAISNPSWWSQITGGTWKGRLHLTGEWPNGGTGPQVYINSITAIHGMTHGTTWLGDNVSTDPVTLLDITAGVTGISHSASSSISGGTTVSTNSGTPWMQRKTINGIDFVLAGDSDHLTDEVSFGGGAQNKQFFLNLAKLPVI